MHPLEYEFHVEIEIEQILDTLIANEIQSFASYTTRVDISMGRPRKTNKITPEHIAQMRITFRPDAINIYYQRHHKSLFSSLYMQDS
jgi:hypothetical protein